MDQTLIDWLKKDFEMFKTEMKDDIGEVNKKVDELLQFKWQVIGGSVIISMIAGILVQFLLAMKP